MALQKEADSTVPLPITEGARRLDISYETEADSIYNLALDCKYGFEEYLRKPRLFHQQVADLQMKFSTWAGFLGVFASVRICLDARLAGTPEMKELFLSMLKVLRRNLDRGLRHHPVLKDQTTIAETSIANDGVMVGIMGSTDRLSRLAHVIRAAAKTDEVERVQRWSQNREPDGFGEVILAMIKHRFSSEKFSMAESLQLQLASSVIYRRNRLLYQARHETKLRADRDEDNYSESAPSVLLDSTWQRKLETIPENPLGQPPSRISQPASQPVQQDQSPPEMARYTHTISPPRRGPESDAASVYSVNPHTTAQYPKPPQLPPGYGQGICNLCGKIQPRKDLTEETRWRRHVIKDLKPYVCVSHECGKIPPAFASRQNWKIHMDSRHGMEWARQIHQPWNWHCPLEDSATTFTSEQRLLDHMISTHSQDLSHSDIVLWCSRSKFPKVLNANICPFCGETVTLTSIVKSTDHIYRPSTAGAMANSPQITAGPPSVKHGSYSSMGGPPSAFFTAALSHDANSIAKTDALRVRMSRHVAEHLESIALWSLRWHDDDSSTGPDASSQGVSANTLREPDFGSTEDVNEDDVAVIDQLQIPDCLPVDWTKATRSRPEMRIPDIPYQSHTFPSVATSGDDVQLEELLRENDVQGDPGLFYPLKTVYRIFTRERVLEQLRSYEVAPNVDHYADLICVDEAGAGTTPAYIKIFAILILIGKGHAIADFVDAELSDKTLPFLCHYDYPNAKRQHHLFLKGSDTPIPALKKWVPHERAAFDTTQRTLLVPYLELGPGNMVQEYNLSGRDVLPWCKSKSSGPESPNSSMVEGAYGKVYCVDIHRDCHAFHQVLQTVKLNGDKFAVKELLKRDFNDEAQFRKELEHLKRFNGLVHDHLVTLLTSVTKGETPENTQYHFVFPFARYDLGDYWRFNHSPPWDKTTVKWVAKQLLGIMGAIDAIHVPKHLHLGTQIAKYGMHGDLKPDNILWFESHKDYRGILVISDFGSADMHSDKSRSNIPNEKVPAVPGYRPPECDIQNGYISQRYDIWTLGCLFLEFLTWLMGGQELLSVFKKERMKTIYVTGAKRDMFYTVKKLEGQTTGAIHLRESIIAKPTEKEWYALEVKPEVKQWIQRLHEDERCPALIHDILDMIENEMLVVLSKDGNESGTGDRSSSTTLKRKLQEWVSKCEVDDGYCFQGRPRPRRPVRQPTVVVAPLNDEVEDCIQLHEPSLLSHNPSHDERRTKSTVLWEDLEERE